MYLASTLKKPAPKRPGCRTRSRPNSISLQCCDRLLVNRARSGEHRAFDEIVRKYRHRLMAVSMRYTSNRADAEDAVQETFLKAHRALANFRGDSAFYSWLHRIAINCAKNVRSLRARDKSVFASNVRGPSGSHDAAMELKEWDTPEGLALTDEICQAVNGAIESLCEEQRVAIVLRELQGLSYADVASSMSCPIGTVRSRVFRARGAIDRQLRQVFDDGLGRAELKNDRSTGSR
jgi:RNA polymerase sigma-70 factor, ECF subfamily